MAQLNSSMRLKVNRDTFFVPDPAGSVYFRNNKSSFRMEGESIDQWIEQLVPIFNGEYRLDEITDGLPDLYRNQVYKIGEMLYRNGFARDVSQDAPHQLPEPIVRQFASQIQFLDCFGESGASRFQSYRQSQVLAVGSGPLLNSLISSLLVSGLPKIHVLVSGPGPTDRQRMQELAAHARQSDPEAVVEEVSLPGEEGIDWTKAVRAYDSVLYVSQEGDLGTLRALHAACRTERKAFIPAVCLHQAGLAGPIVQPDQEGCWESAWRSIHEAAICKDPQMHTYSSTAGAMLANVIVFELFKKITGVKDGEPDHQVYLLNLETLEGRWHSFVPHPLVSGHAAAKWLPGFEQQLEVKADNSENALLSFFSGLTSEVTGIFHQWEEGDFIQLPLSQCRVQAVDPLSEGPARLLQGRLCNALTHVEARREAGFAGIEAYVSRMAGQLSAELLDSAESDGGRIEPEEFIGVGAGETVAEGIARGLQSCLAEVLNRRLAHRQPEVQHVQLSEIEDQRCQFYLKALTTMEGEPVMGWGEEVLGFPVIWIGTGGRWYSGVGRNATLALRNALQHALLEAQNPPASLGSQVKGDFSVSVADHPQISLAIPSAETTPSPEELKSALQVLARNGKRLLVLDLNVAPFLKEGLAGVYGVLLREEAIR
ncbi:putative thiazole-containing bacteriocin maturation protein [Paenibacillus puerhi]|uniref:putative thiazole-containing bacteriocin maturation protein n=1 Tax=Paenibacillus puerhi TaxID=2692622 RepID=UPI00135B55C4|nr:putative thiazole-containing bacteriocin maturation protein [Paenibacillus puerhi]